MQPLIINLAGTGAVPTRRENPHVPLTPDEISEDCAQCCRLGAAIVHLHAREPDGTPSCRIEIYREIIRKVRAAASDAIVCVSTTGRHFKSFEERSRVLDLEDDLKPDMASLTLGSMNFATQASVNDPAMIRALADRMRERGIVPELEVFELGMIDYAKFLLDRGVLSPPLYFNLLLGSLGTLSATPLNLAHLVQALPAGSTWAAAGIGRFQFPTNALALAMDGHVRVGLEDNLYMDDAKSKPASNPALVARIVTLARAAGRTIATPAQARELIGLPRRARAVV
jgi:3-keto-5-aminohexanoate cleavage enzyme